MIRYSFILLCCVVLFWSCTPTEKDEAPISKFENPILAGFNPDPSICRVEDDYYLINSSFAYFPGLPILHSKDLVNWNQIGAAITRTEQMDLTNSGFSRGLYAPAISYHDGWFYVVCTLVDLGGNFVVRSKTPGGPYSEPFWIPEINGIDPSMFFDEDGKSYVVYNSTPPDNQPLYGGHRTLRMYEFDLDSMKVVGEEVLLVNGGTDIAKEPVWIEGPHIYKTNGWYYLMAAEGGTGYNHSEVIFRSQNVKGPYEVFEGNPILTQRHLDPSRPDPITTTGHADLVQTASGEWWAVFLGCRPYEGPHFNTGRETFLAPVSWENGWPIITRGEEEVKYQYPVPKMEHTTEAEIKLSGKINYRIDFDESLDQRWLFLRNVKEDWYSLDTQNGQISLDLRPIAIDEKDNPSLMLRRQPHLYGSATTQIRFSPENENEMAGLVILQRDNHFYFINKTADQIQVLKKIESGYEELASQPYGSETVHLRIEADGSYYHFFYSEDGKNFSPLLREADAKYLSTETAGGFVGCMYGLYASSNGTESTNQALFDYFELTTE